MKKQAARVCIMTPYDEREKSKSIKLRVYKYKA